MWFSVLVTSENAIKGILVFVAKWLWMNVPSDNKYYKTNSLKISIFSYFD